MSRHFSTAVFFLRPVDLRRTGRLCSETLSAKKLLWVSSRSRTGTWSAESKFGTSANEVSGVTASASTARENCSLATRVRSICTCCACNDSAMTANASTFPRIFWHASHGSVTLPGTRSARFACRNNSTRCFGPLKATKELNSGFTDDLLIMLASESDLMFPIVSLSTINPAPQHGLTSPFAWTLITFPALQRPYGMSSISASGCFSTSMFEPRPIGMQGFRPT